MSRLREGGRERGEEEEKKEPPPCDSEGLRERERARGGKKCWDFKERAFREREIDREGETSGIIDGPNEFWVIQC